MSKYIIYSVYYNDSDNLQIFSINKEAEAQNEAIAFRIKEALNDDAKKRQEVQPIDGLKYFYGKTQKSGKWNEQQEALKDAALNYGGVYVL